MLIMKYKLRIQKNTLRLGLKNLAMNTNLGLNLFRFVRSKFSGVFVSKDTNLLIDGFPRSGQTYLYSIVHNSLKHPIKIARHRHEPLQISLAVSLKIPVIIIIRNPIDSIASFITREKVSYRYAIHLYKNYYNHLHLYSRCLNFLEFERFITDPIKSILRFKYILPLRHNLEQESNEIIENAKRYVEELEKLDSEGEVRATHVALPSQGRQNHLREVKKILSINHQKEIHKIEKIYNDLTNFTR